MERRLVAGSSIPRGQAQSASVDGDGTVNAVTSLAGEDRERVIILNLMDSLINLREKLTAGKRLKRSSCANLDDLFCNINELIQLVK